MITKKAFEGMLEPGDWILTTPTRKMMKAMKLWKLIKYTVTFFFIRLVSACRYIHITHANKTKKKGYVFYSTEPPVAKELTFSDFDQADIMVMRRRNPWTNKQLRRATEVWKTRYKGKRYDEPQLVAMLINWMFGIRKNKMVLDIQPNRYVCSTAIAGLERSTGVNTFGKKNTARINPGDCLRNKARYKSIRIKNGIVKMQYGIKVDKNGKAVR